MKKFAIAVTAAIAFSLPAAALASVTESVRKTVDEVVQVVSNPEMKKASHEKQRRAALKKAIGEIFDYGEMAKRSMGTHWKEITPAQQKEFVGLFATLLENSYAGKIESYNNEKIVYG